MNIQAELFIFSEEFKRSFASSGLTPELLTLISWVLGIACGILVLGMVAQLVWRYRHPKQGHHHMNQPRRIMALLEQGLTERSRFELTFDTEILQGEGIHSYPVALNTKELTLDLPDQVAPKPAWIGRPVTIYFSLMTQGHSRTFYTFQSTIAAIDRDPSGLNLLRILLPAHIAIGQRRMHFRLAPDKSTIFEVMLWLTPHQPWAKNHTGPTRWGLPMARHHLMQPETSSASLKIVDLSAGGCRIAIANNPRLNTYLDNNQSPDVLLFLSLLDQEGGNLEIYLVGKIRAVICDPLENTRSLGIAFTMTGHLQQPTGHHITWTPLSKEEGHPEIGNWVFKQHLNLFRQQEKNKKQADRAARMTKP